MSDTHAMAPPPELVRQWTTSFDCPEAWGPKDQWIASKAAQWGADRELDACCEWHRNRGYSRFITLREDRRPKPPSLKEQALKTVDEMSDCMSAGFVPKRSDLDAIRRALEALPE